MSVGVFAQGLSAEDGEAILIRISFADVKEDLTGVGVQSIADGFPKGYCRFFFPCERIGAVEVQVARSLHGQFGIVVSRQAITGQGIDLIGDFGRIGFAKIAPALSADKDIVAKPVISAADVFQAQVGGAVGLEIRRRARVGGAADESGKQVVHEGAAFAEVF